MISIHLSSIILLITLRKRCLYQVVNIDHD